ncbi:hypothetical protein SAPIO_CDS2779 [Scedosporium apiospermum]|uniref:Uncharacterized protein n=1 Tax=Pseudallescheria apiosperma TaxID=563466 RepID=A0A084GBI6_PSEDA|nr:uncharacterized protein SAPIO_CDS2779 [Scedosporium apiospermum]KEZ44698.1 hypothetical protein SAPIO_CDS2779 [Scedosporium apiospermum]
MEFRDQIHGLNAGSRKTWSYSEDPRSFWPAEWLPQERGFRKGRIHTFGYDPDFAKDRKSALTIHDFGPALVAGLANSSHLRRNPNVNSP